MQPVIFYTIAMDEINKEYARKMINSFKKFNDYPITILDKKDLEKIFKHPLMGDDFYRLTPATARTFDDYELVVRLDADQVILGDLEYVVETRHNYDLGVVLNANRIDPLRYPAVEGWGIGANEYYNLGFVAFTNKRLIDHLWNLCNSKYFHRLRMREQDLINILAHYGDYRVKCFDHYDKKNNYYAWHGLVAKGEGVKMKIKNNQVILPRGEDNYPDHELVVKAYHWAGGPDEPKWNLHNHFNPEVVDYITKLIQD